MSPVSILAAEGVPPGDNPGNPLARAPSAAARRDDSRPVLSASGDADRARGEIRDRNTVPVIAAELP